MNSGSRRSRRRYSGSFGPTSLGLVLVSVGLLFGFFWNSHRQSLDAVTLTPKVLTTTTSPSPSRKVFPLSVIHGGAYSPKELERARRTDSVVAAHYADFGTSPRFQKLPHALLMYVSYRRGNQVFWSQTKHRIAQGEIVISNGNCMARARCGNRLSATPQGPVGPQPPSEDALNTPEAPDEPVSYKLADLPGPAGRTFDLALPPSFDELRAPGAATVPTSGIATGSGSAPSSFGSGPTGFSGGSGPLIGGATANSKAPGSTAAASTPSTPGTPIGSSGSTPLAPTTTGTPAGASPATAFVPSTTGGSTLPTSPDFPGTNSTPATTSSESVNLVPEPAYSFAFLAMIGIWLVRRRGLLRG